MANERWWDKVARGWVVSWGQPASQLMLDGRGTKREKIDHKGGYEAVNGA